MRKELIRPHPATLRDDVAFRFRHLLIRDAAYDGLPKAARAELHERFARMARAHGRELVELDEIVGWHLEQVIRYTRELGQALDPTLARDAAEHLHSAGARACQRSDQQAARNLLGRALALVAEPDPLHARICVDLGEQLVDIGELTQADELLKIAEDNPETASLATLPRLEWLSLSRPDEAIGALKTELPGLLNRFSQAGDERGLAKAHLLAWGMHWLASQATPAAAEAKLAAEHARKAGDRGLQARALSLELPPLVRDFRHTRELAKRLDELEHADLGPYLLSRVILGRAWLALLEGRFADARKFAQQAIDAYRTLGMPLMQFASRQVLAEIELDSGDPATARALLQEVDAFAASVGERGYRSTVQALTAVTEEALGGREAALAAIELSDQLSAPEDVINYAITHPVRARLALAEGDAEAAERWARSAVHYAFITDFPQTRGCAKLDLARVLKRLGRAPEAAFEARAALELFTAKGDRPGGEQARTLLDSLSIGD